MNEIRSSIVSTSMRAADRPHECQTNEAEPVRVRVNYVPRGFGLALTISDDEAIDVTDAASTETEVEPEDGYLTVIECGVTTLELRRPDGGSSYLIWDQAEVAWESLRAG